MSVRAADSRRLRAAPSSVRAYQPVERKISRSKAITLYLPTRTVWEEMAIESFKSDLLQAHPAPRDCVLEGVVQVNPWLLPMNCYVAVEVFARLTYNRSQLEDSELQLYHDVAFSRQVIFPPPCETFGLDCLKKRPDNLDRFQPITRALYDKLGGPVGTAYELEEKINQHGVENTLGTRFKHTIIPPTEATKSTNAPNRPYLYVNHLFRFDLEGEPESVTLHHRDSRRRGCTLQPKDPASLRYDAQVGFLARDDCSGISSTEDESDSDSGPCKAIHPGERKQRSASVIARNNRRRERRLDGTQKDGKPWAGRVKKKPVNGITWYVRAFAAENRFAKPFAQHKAKLSFLKLNYSPNMDSMSTTKPKKMSRTLHYAQVPAMGRDAGHISIVGRLSATGYRPGDAVKVFVKLHNRSARVVQAVSVELVQVVQLAAITGQQHRTVLVKRVFDCERDDKIFPILPGTTNLLLCAQLHPWPPADIPLNASKYDMEPKLYEEELGAYLLRKSPFLSRLDDYTIAEQKIPKSTDVRFVPACSTIYDVPEKRISSLSGLQSTWQAEALERCRCQTGTGLTKRRNGAKMPPQPYQEAPLLPVVNPHSLAKPVFVSYEVVVSAILLPTAEPPCGDRVEPKTGPSVTLPLIFLHAKPFPDRPLKVSNINIDPLYERKPRFPPPPLPHEPNHGRGNYTSRSTKLRPEAICKRDVLVCEYQEPTNFQKATERPK